MTQVTIISLFQIFTPSLPCYYRAVILSATQFPWCPCRRSSFENIEPDLHMEAQMMHAGQPHVNRKWLVVLSSGPGIRTSSCLLTSYLFFWYITDTRREFLLVKLVSFLGTACFISVKHWHSNLSEYYHIYLVTESSMFHCYMHALWG